MARASTLRKVVEHAAAGALSLLTVKLDDPTGYGRIVRAPRAKSRRSSSRRTRRPSNWQIAEINTGMMAAPTAAQALADAHRQTTTRNGEYYLTDVVATGGRRRRRSRDDRGAGEMSAKRYGVNSKQQLAELERDLSARAGGRAARRGRDAGRSGAHRRARRLCNAGATWRSTSIACSRAQVTLGGQRVRSAPTACFATCSDRTRARSSRRSRISRSARSALAAASGLMRACGRARCSPRKCTSAISSKSRRARSARAARRIIWPTSATRRSGATSTSAPAPSPATTTARTSIAR